MLTKRHKSFSNANLDTHKNDVIDLLTCRFVDRQLGVGSGVHSSSEMSVVAILERIHR